MNIQFRGLTSLRFFAALLVILFHSVITLNHHKIVSISLFPIFNKSDEAVSFFFTLSGFLITYLLLAERKKYDNINIKAFYTRRILRIWPLYFLVVFIGLVFYNFILPLLKTPFTIEYKLFYAVLLYIFFLPNVLSNCYDVGGILNPTWSIGIEEQFYLLWAPILKVTKKGTLLILILIFILFISLRIIASYKAFGLHEVGTRFIYSLRFHYMALGGIGAYWVVNFQKRITESKILKNKISQIIHISLLLAWLFYYNYQFQQYIHFIFVEVLVLYLFLWLILNVALIENSIIRVDFRITQWLGKISYGLYLLHMIVITGVLFVLQIYPITMISNDLKALVIILAIIVITIAISAISYYIFEKPFLELKKKFELV